MLEIEESERQQRSLKRRLSNARLGSFKPMANFDYDWPEELDRALFDELFTCAFLEQTANVVIVGPNGLGKTMIAKNLLHQAIQRSSAASPHASPPPPTCCMTWPPRTAPRSSLGGYTAIRYTAPTVLCVDEVGYFSYDARYADLLFEVITRRYQQHRSLVLTTNKAFGEWNQVFPNATASLLSSIGSRTALRSSASLAIATASRKRRSAPRNAPRVDPLPRSHGAGELKAMQPDDLPIVCLPTELTDEAAASLLDFLYQLTEAIERSNATTPFSPVMARISPGFRLSDTSLRARVPGNRLVIPRISKADISAGVINSLFTSAVTVRFIFG